MNGSHVGNFLGFRELYLKKAILCTAKFKQALIPALNCAEHVLKSQHILSMKLLTLFKTLQGSMKRVKRPFSLLGNFNISDVIENKCRICRISAFRVMWHTCNFPLFPRNCTQYSALYQIYNSKALLSFRRAEYI